jgi:hydroxypyruvate reductase
LQGRVPFDDPHADPRRGLLVHLFRAALAAVDGRRRVRAALAGGQVGPDVSVFAVGKAAPAMALGAADALGGRLVRGLVVAPDGSIPAALRALAGIDCREAGHPRPDARSIAAGEALLAFAEAARHGGRVLLLVSGGASALVEVPAPGVGVAELTALYERSLAERLDIEALNRERAAVSRIKGGRLGALFGGAPVEALLLSDVPRDDPAVLGSGIADGPGIARRLVGSIEDSLEAVLRAASARGISAERAATRLEGDAASAARRVCHELAIGGADLHAYGGETTVALPPRPGRGGRCQHLATAASLAIAGHPDYLVLAAGTDGRDGASEDAGAIVDGATAERAADAGLDPAAALAAGDSGSLLEATGDLLHTGPTGTNVGDLVLALRRPPGEIPAR